jgi:hypothetical protein
VHFRVELFRVSKFGYAFTVDTSVSQIVKTVRTNQFVPIDLDEKLNRRKHSASQTSKKGSRKQPCEGIGERLVEGQCEEQSRRQ